MLDAAAHPVTGSEPSLSLASVEAGVKSMFSSFTSLLHMNSNAHSNRPTQLAAAALFSSHQGPRDARAHDNFAGALLVHWAFEGDGAAAIDAVYERRCAEFYTSRKIRSV